MTTSDQHSPVKPTTSTPASAHASSTGPKPRIADTIYYRSTQYQFDVDGQPFPWHITTDGITAEWMHNSYPLLTFDFIAHHVDTDTEVPITVRRWLPGDNQP